MALRGAGDPRWVVRERDDGRNVNGWHWEDKDVTGWAGERLKELITGDTCSAGHELARVVVQCVESVEGDATLYNRKGVLKVLYDLKVSGKWTSLQVDESERTYGEFKFELWDEEPEVTATMDGKSRGVSALREAFLKGVGPLIRKQCLVFIDEMNRGAGQAVDGLRLPTKHKADETRVTDYLRSGMTQKGLSKKKKSSSASTGEVEMRETFTCGATDMYLALTDRARLEAITRGRAVSEARVGGAVDLLNGTATGRYSKLLIGKEVRMEWKLKTWGESAGRGQVTVWIAEEEGKTEVRVRVEGVPNEHRSATEGFWRVQILQAIKVVMGWGSASQFL